MSEITYEIILKHLAPKKNNFITEKHHCNFNFFNKYTDILTSEFYRYGVETHDNKKNNISFWGSLLTLIQKDYLINCEDLSLITEYKNYLIDNYSKKISNFLRKYEKHDFREYFKLNPDIIIIQYIVDIININIIIFDFNDEENIYAIYKNDIMDTTNKTILIANNKNNWEPIFTNDKKIFNIDDQIIKKILENNIKYYSQENVNKIFNYSQNIDIKLSQKNKKNKSDTQLNLHKNIEDSNDVLISSSGTNSSESSNQNIESIVIKTNNLNITKSKLLKLKKDQLILILEKHNINYLKKNTNKQLIELINENNLI